MRSVWPSLSAGSGWHSLRAGSASATMPPRREQRRHGHQSANWLCSWHRETDFPPHWTLGSPKSVYGTDKPNNEYNTSPSGNRNLYEHKHRHELSRAQVEDSARQFLGPPRRRTRVLKDRVDQASATRKRDRLHLENMSPLLKLQCTPETTLAMHRTPWTIQATLCIPETTLAKKHVLQNPEGSRKYLIAAIRRLGLS